MQVLQLEPGDLLQVKSTDLPQGSFIKLQAQSTSFLDISDPKAVLETVFRNYSCFTIGDVFTFEYNDQTFDMAVQEIKPDGEKHAISVVETDLEVDFATPVGYEEPSTKNKGSGTSTPRGTGAQKGGRMPSGGFLHPQGTMAQAINYASISPEATAAATGAKAMSSNFLLGGQKLSSKKGSKTPTPQASTPVAGTSTNQPAVTSSRRRNGPQPLRLPPGKLFFGYPVKLLKKDGEVTEEMSKPRFEGQGQTLRGGKKKDG